MPKRTILKVWCRTRKYWGLLTSFTHRPCHEGCNGTRVRVLWAGGRVTYPCTAGMTHYNNGNYRIG